MRDLEEENRYVFFATRNGTVKKTPLNDFSNVRSSGINAIAIEKEDELVAASCTDGNQIIFLATHDGRAIRFDESDVRTMGRAAYGVRGMKLGRGDYIVGMAVTPKTRKEAKNGEEQEANLILSVTENGYGKRTDVDEYRLTSRGGKGIINVKTTARNGKVVSIMLVNEESEVMVISQFGKIIRIGTKTIRECGRSSQGVRLLHLEEGDRVAATSVIPPEEAARERQRRERIAGAVAAPCRCRITSQNTAEHYATLDLTFTLLAMLLSVWSASFFSSRVSCRSEAISCCSSSSA